MWIHIVIFMVILGAFLAGKLGRLPPWAGNAEGQKLFILVALAGNIIGMLLTVQRGDRCLRREIHSICRRKKSRLPVCAGAGKGNGKVRGRAGN